MQPFPSPPQRERRGLVTLVLLLATGFVVASTIAIVEFVQLRAATERVERLEEGGAQPTDGDGGLLGELEELFDGLAGSDELLGDQGLSLLGCLEPAAGGGGASVREIAERVERIRGLAFTEPVEPRFLDDQRMTARVRDLFLEEYTPRIADLDQRLLTALGAIPPGTDLRALRSDAVGQQVAGFYDPETDELVVRSGTAELSTLDRITLAHELTHALTDQVLGIPLPERVEVGQEDRDLAGLALVEGDASLVMQRYALSLGLSEQLELLDPEVIAESEAGVAELPPYLRKELLFPYEAGLEFVCELYADGGWEAVNRAYREPPATTAAILFPGRYLGGPDEPRDPPDPGAPGRGWTELARLQLGAANLLWLFQAPGGDPGRAVPEAEDAVAVWAGGEAVVWGSGRRTAVGISLEELPGEELLCPAITTWYRSAFEGDREQLGPTRLIADGERQDAVVACTEDGVRVGIGPDPATSMAQTR